MRIPYCLPIHCHQTQEVERLVEQHQEDFRFFEIWLDPLEDFSLPWLEKIVQLSRCPLIFLFRRKKLHPPRMSIQERRRAMHTLRDLDVMVDFDLTSQASDLAWWQKHATPQKLLLSSHHYDQTPSPQDLNTLIETMRSIPAAIYKIAAMCHTHQDTHRLMQIILDAPTLFGGAPSVILGMGEVGMRTRIFGTLMGNHMLFAPVHASEATAQGQHTRDQYQQIFQLLLSQPST